jgi:hypothetical protein
LRRFSLPALFSIVLHLPAHRFILMGMNHLPLFSSILLIAFSAGLCAEPAPWYQWRSKADGKRVCAQTSLGPGWERAAGPFRDSRCEKRFLVK